jgi:hypothetical protein
MKQREHEIFDSLAVLKEASPPEAARVSRQRAKLPKHAREATCVFRFFAIAAAGRIGEKNPHFSPHIDQNGPIA